MLSKEAQGRTVPSQSASNIDVATRLVETEGDGREKFILRRG